MLPATSGLEWDDDLEDKNSEIFKKAAAAYVAEYEPYVLCKFFLIFQEHQKSIFSKKKCS